MSYAQDAAMHTPARGAGRRAGRRTALDFPGRFPIWIGALLAVAIVTAYPQFTALVDGFSAPTVELGIFRYVREGLFAGLWLDFLVWAMTSASFRPKLSGWLLFCGIALYIGVLAFRSIVFLETPPVVVALGVRAIGFAMIAVCAYYAAQQDGEALLGRLALMTKIFLGVQAFAAVQQLALPAPFGQTIFGTRVFGFTPNPIILSQVVCASFAVLVARRERRLTLWFLLSLGLAVLSGGRSGIIGIVLVLLVQLLFARVGPELKVGAGLAAAAMIVSVYLLSSIEAISGRPDVPIGLGEGRLEAWTTYLDEMLSESNAPLFLGQYVGAGSNAVNSWEASSLYGSVSDNYYGVVADSFYAFLVLSFGLIGLSGFLTVFTASIWRHRRSQPVVLVAVTFAWLAVSQNVVEIFPANVLLLATFGISLGSFRD